jgi:predicted nuclease of predicted toxin-antitoxin system
MRFLADMGVSQSVVELLRSEGYDAVHLREEGLQKLSDMEIFQKGDIEDRIVITFDLGFGEIVASSLQTVSVIVYRLRNARAAHQVDRLRAVLSAVAEDIQRGAVVVIEEGRHRIRKLPIGEI